MCIKGCNFTYDDLCESSTSFLSFTFDFSFFIFFYISFSYTHGFIDFWVLSVHVFFWPPLVLNHRHSWTFPTLPHSRSVETWCWKCKLKCLSSSECLPGMSISKFPLFCGAWTLIIKLPMSQSRLKQFSVHLKLVKTKFTLYVFSKNQHRFSI